MVPVFAHWQGIGFMAVPVFVFPVVVSICEHAQRSKPGRAGVIGCGKKGNFVVSLAK